MGIYASNALPVLQANGPWSVTQANVPWLTQQVGNLTVQGSAVALPSSTPYLVTAAQTLPVLQTSNVGIYASNALPVLQANVPWLTQQVGNVTVQGSAVALPSSSPYSVTAAQALPVLQTSNVGIYASNALPVLQSNAPWTVLQANVFRLTQQVGNVTVQGSAVALPSSTPYLVTAAQTLPVLQTSNVGIYASNALPVLQANGPWSVLQANVPWLTQQVGNVTVQGSAVALPSSAPYLVTAAQALPVLQANGPWSVLQANVPWLTQPVGNVTVQGSAVALPSSSPYPVVAAQALPVLQANAPWLVQGAVTLSTQLQPSTPSVVTKSLMTAQEASNASVIPLTTSGGSLLVAPQFTTNVGAPVLASSPAGTTRSVLVAQETTSNTTLGILSTSNGALVVSAPALLNSTFGGPVSLGTPSLATRSMLSAVEAANSSVAGLHCANGVLLVTPQYSGNAGQPVTANTPADAVRAALSAVDMNTGAYAQLSSLGGYLINYCAGGTVNAVNPYTLSGNVADTSTCHLTRSLLTGRQAANAYTSVAATSQGLLGVSTEEPQDHFGHQLVSAGRSCIGMNFSYDVSPLFVQTAAVSGTVAQARGALTLSGNSAVSVVTASSVQCLPAACGSTATVTCSAAFVNGNVGLVGYGNLLEGVFFGYSQSTFGVLARVGGTPEIRTLTVTGAASASTTANVTVDNFYAAIAATGTTVQALSNALWTAVSAFPAQANLAITQVGTSLTFVSTAPGPRTGRYSFSCTTPNLGTAATAAFANVQTGVTAVETFTPQASWNVDPADGSRAMPPLAPAAGANYTIKLNPYGFGPAWCYVSDQVTGRAKLAHVIRPSGGPLFYRPSLPVSFMLTGAGNLRALHGSASLEGEPPFDALYNSPCNRSASTFASGLTVATTAATNVLSLCNLPVFRGTDNRQQVTVTSLSATCSNTGGKPMALQAIVNGTLADPGGAGLAFASVNQNSCCSTCVSTAACSGGAIAATLQLSANATVVSQLRPNSLVLLPGDQCCFAVIANRSAAAAAEVDLSVSWSESP